ncbi:alcohol dehydrogenase catalytic domain-containing protein [Corynebacterium sp. S7]
MSENFRIAQVRSAGGPLEIHQVPIPETRPDQVLVHVRASGMCGADIGTARARGGQLPVTPGHEVAGTVEKLGSSVQGFAVGDRVAVGWFGGSCGHCDACRRGDVVHCPKRQVPGLSYPGGWAEKILVPASALAHIPDQLSFEEAAPMGCAGVTTYNALRNAHLAPGSRVAVFGIGGLGHMAVQFAAQMGFEVVAIARGPEREEAAEELGATYYIDSSVAEPGQALADLGGADLILTTASSTDAVTGLISGLRTHGRLTMIGIDGGSVEIPAARLVMNGISLSGHLTGSPTDIEDAMHFAAVTRVRPVTEALPLDDAAQALDRLRSGAARFRLVLTTEPVQ